jgi:hypothetical protein
MDCVISKENSRVKVSMDCVISKENSRGPWVHGSSQFSYEIQRVHGSYEIQKSLAKCNFKREFKVKDWIGSLNFHRN